MCAWWRGEACQLGTFPEKPQLQGVNVHLPGVADALRRYKSETKVGADWKCKLCGRGNGELSYGGDRCPVMDGGILGCPGLGLVCE
eukprot:scaffold220235_cov28-Tisochrysis_lutea.AAC.3